MLTGWIFSIVFPVLLRRGVLPAPAGIRPLVADALAPAHGRGEAAGAVAGEPRGRHEDRGDEPSDLARVVIDTTVQPKAVMFPTDAKLMNRPARLWCSWRNGTGSSFN